MDVNIETFLLGPLQTSCYVVTHGEHCWIVDAGLWPKPLIDQVAKAGLTPQTLLLTHGHADHIGGAQDMKLAWPDLQIVCPLAEADMLSDSHLNMAAAFGLDVTAPPANRLVRPGETLEMGELTWQVLDTAGHTKGGVSYYSSAAGVVFTGDALFAGSIGRTDIRDGDADQLLANIRNHLLTLPDETRVLPGHGMASTIGQEKASNPFC
jgi:glyoxylase-like metal-dependent hydrolase (beta-lactamase superfamily II)